MDSQPQKQESLDSIFTLLREGDVPEADILAFSKTIDVSDVDWLMEYVGRLKGPDDFMDDIDECSAADNARSEIIAKGFFLLIDLVSAVILKLGEPAIVQLRRFERSNAHYVPWVIKYCTDERFRKELRASLPFLNI